MLNGEKFSDVVLCVDSQQFQAHKSILSVRSPVFAAMFSHDTKELQQNLVEISDMTSKVMNALLNFIYTGGVSPEDLTVELLRAADKVCFRFNC